MKISLIVNSVLLLLLLIGFWFGRGSYPQLWQLEESIAQQQIENTKLTKQVSRLQAELKDLREGHTGVEHKARAELGMVKPGETYYRYINADDEKSLDDEPDKLTETQLNIPDSEDSVGSNIIFNAADDNTADDKAEDDNAQDDASDKASTDNAAKP